MSDPLIVGFSGKKRAGKDTAGDIAAEDFGFERDAIASPIKTIAQEVFGLADHQVYGKAKEIPDSFWEMTPRKIMQKVGTEFARGVFHEEIWIDSFKRRMETAEANKIVVTDVRFPNEVKAIQDLGGAVIRIRRPEKEPDLNPVLKWAALQYPPVAEWLPSKYHQSETALDGFDDFNLTVVNDGTIRDLETVITRILDRTTSFHGRNHPQSHPAHVRLPGLERAEVSCEGKDQRMETVSL